jgi:hypothetical protein
MTTCNQCGNYGHHRMDCRLKCCRCNNTGHTGGACQMNTSSHRAPPPVQQRVNPPAQQQQRVSWVQCSDGAFRCTMNNGGVYRRGYNGTPCPSGPHGTAMYHQAVQWRPSVRVLHVPTPMYSTGGGMNPGVFGIRFSHFG